VSAAQSRTARGGTIHEGYARELLELVQHWQTEQEA
jgi:hypothetical protein